MGTYASATDVQALFQGLDTFAAGTQPTSTQVTNWITEAEAFLEGALLAAGLTAPCVNTRGIEILSSWACLYAGGQVRNALSAAANDPSAAAGQPMLEEFNKWVQWIMDHPLQAGNMLEGGSPSTASRMKSYPQNNTDDLSIDDGDFEPLATNEMEQW